MGGSRTATAASWGYRLQSTVYNSTLQQGSFSAGLRGTFLVASLTFALLFALFAKWINFAHLPPVLSHHSLLSPHMQTEISGIGLWTLQRGESESKSLAAVHVQSIVQEAGVLDWAYSDSADSAALQVVRKCRAGGLNQVIAGVRSAIK